MFKLKIQDLKEGSHGSLEGIENGDDKTSRGIRQLAEQGSHITMGLIYGINNLWITRKYTSPLVTSND